jgi:hypothetical protein
MSGSGLEKIPNLLGQVESASGASAVYEALT